MGAFMQGVGCGTALSVSEGQKIAEKGGQIRVKKGKKGWIGVIKMGGLHY